MKIKHFWVWSNCGYYMDVGVHSTIPGAYEAKLEGLKRIYPKGYTIADGKIIDSWGMTESEKQEIKLS